MLFTTKTSCIYSIYTNLNSVFLNQSRQIHEAASRESVEDILQSTAEAEGLMPIEEGENSDTVGEYHITQEAEEVVEGSGNVKDTGFINVHEETEPHVSKHTESAARDAKGIWAIDEVKNSDGVGDPDATQVGEDDIEMIVNLEDASLISVPTVSKPYGL